MMTSKHYRAIAAELAAIHAVPGTTVDQHRAINRLTDAIAVVMAEDNPRFDRSRFLGAAAWDGRGL